jgi:predicted metal-dependent HD superfamily phosphohydrolase
MLQQTIYDNIRGWILPRLKQSLASDLTYHSVNHSIDVETQALRIAVQEAVTDAESIFLLKIACLYHDSGFLFTYKEHEAAGCRLVREELPGFGLNDQQIDQICGMIMATKIPQTPHNKLEEIICDADLDYLGRDDFFPIAHTLFLEWKSRFFIVEENEWNHVQYNFFKLHHYFTASNKALRGPLKLKHFKIIEDKLIAE